METNTLLCPEPQMETTRGRPYNEIRQAETNNISVCDKSQQQGNPDRIAAALDVLLGWLLNGMHSTLPE